ncbi:gastrula zinc finger protein XlCGF26.1-like isoform X2 [Rhinatrema bivittatum]|uniref:gastrula zinc finger protein XlCGF26.1-like isoform X2 n=1 Tax=Rhinatrema bivittatum TaxID=194408 RepID=UPI00112EF19E|nr:gastrula zinc finger protein XlCGF26.1-like isoform X2 [Rhinatrema bivittatum]
MAEAEPAQVSVTFEDVTVYFCEDEWEMLEEWQKELYKKTMQENYETLTSLGSSCEKPSLISKIERKEDPCVRDKQDPRDRRRLKSSWTGYGINHENKKQQMECAENRETHKMLPEKDKERFIQQSDVETDWRRESDSSKERGITTESRGDTDSISGNITITTRPQTRTKQNISTYRKREENFTRKDKLMFHQLRQTQEKSIQCTECGKNFSSMSYLRMHQRMHRGKKACSESFSQRMPGMQPQRIHKGQKQFICPDCGKSFHRKSVLKEHQIIHMGDALLQEKPFACLECGKGFILRSSLTKHKRIHIELKPYTCSYCSKSFNDKSNFKKHQIIHTGEKPFSCPECGKSFNDKSNLKQHQRIHTGYKPFACLDCGKRFNRKTHLNTHQRNHTGEKPFTCPDCGKSFGDRSNLSRHQLTHMEEYLFICPDCGKSYNDKSKIKSHKLTHMGEKPFTCPDCDQSFCETSKQEDIN